MNYRPHEGEGPVSQDSPSRAFDDLDVAHPPLEHRDDNPDVQARLHGTQTKEKKVSRRGLLAGLIGGAVLAGGTAFGVHEATKPDTTPNPEPTATGPANPGSTEPTAQTTAPNSTDPTSETSGSNQGEKLPTFDTQITNHTYEEIMAFNYDLLKGDGTEDPETVLKLWMMGLTKVENTNDIDGIAGVDVESSAELRSEAYKMLYVGGKPPRAIERQAVQIQGYILSQLGLDLTEEQVRDEFTFEWYADLDNVVSHSKGKFTADVTVWSGLNTPEGIEATLGDRWHNFDYQSAADQYTFELIDYKNPETKKTEKRWAVVVEN